VAGAPALRAYAFGPAVSIDDIQAALHRLDEMADLPALGTQSGAGVAL
jgi:hypothetical protein